MLDYDNPAYDRACQQIRFWYRKGERCIAISPQTFADYSEDLHILMREIDGPIPAPVPRRLIYKDAIVYVPDGWY